MQRYRLSLQGLVDPFWLTDVRHGEHQVQVEQNGTVALNGKTLVLNQPSITPGTQLTVWLGFDGFFYASLAAEYEADQVARKAQAQAEQDRREADRDRRAADAKAFNASLAVPAKWATANKDVLSGLSAGSNGDGLKRNSVAHVLLKEDLKRSRRSRRSRLIRRSGDLLCSSESSQNGRQWSDNPQMDHLPGEDSSFKVTCKACLKLCAQWAPSHDPVRD
jgi:hypothetical protein